MTEILDVCVCTHNPNPHIFQVVLKALANQTLAKNAYHVWIIDNGSSPAITDQDLQSLTETQTRYTLLQEERLGLVYARCCAIKATQSDVVVFVDDDNELDIDYLSNVLDIAKKNPDIGCFGGRQHPPTGATIPEWSEPFLPFLAIADRGEEIITKCVDYWGQWEPCGAGIVARRSVLEQYIKTVQTIPMAGKMGRKGSTGLMSGEDSLLARGAYPLGLACSYQPRLKLIHHINFQKRLKPIYLLRLFLNYGRTYIVLDRILGQTFESVSWQDAWEQIQDNKENRESKSQLYDWCMIMWDVGRLLEQGIIWNWDLIQPWTWNFYSQKNVVSYLDQPTTRIPLSEKSVLLSRLKSNFNQPWEFCRRLALKLNLIH